MRSYQKLWLTLGLAAALTASATGATQATPASTNGGTSIDYYWDCPVGAFCVWDHKNGYGDMLMRPPQMPETDLRDAGVDGDWNDRIRSVWNRTGQVWCTFVDINYSSQSGKPWPVGNWQGNTAQYNMDMRISSFRPGPC